MADPKSGEAAPLGLSESGRATVEDAIKAAIERTLVAEVVRSPEDAMSFDRIFNKDAPDFSRLFSRGGTRLQDLTVQDVARMDDALFAKFIERVRLLQNVAGSESMKAR